MRINGRERHLHACVDSMIVIDDSGGESVASFTDEEAISLFVEWLADARATEAAPSYEYGINCRLGHWLTCLRSTGLC